MKSFETVSFLFFLFITIAFAIELPPSPGMRLIQIDNTRQWMSEEHVDRLSRSKEARFMDVTDTQDLDTDVTLVSAIVYPDEPNQKELMAKLLPHVSKQNLTEKITNLSTMFASRHCTHVDGKKAAEWIKKQYQDIVASLAPERRALFEVKFVPTPSRPQPSVVAIMRGSSPQSEVVVLGAHEDSITHRRTQREPGADDDASGSATIMEVFRIVAQSTVVFKRSIEFHHYACEETGLLGSRAIAQIYKNEGKKVHAYANIDMTGYKNPRDPTVGVITDYTDPELNKFFIKVIKAYSDVQVQTWRCGYACGDHYSWYVAGFRALVYPHEVTSMRNLNPYYHTDQDTVDKFDLDRATEFVKFTLGFGVEMANN